jgi:hypothetical protein
MAGAQIEADIGTADEHFRGITYLTQRDRELRGQAGAAVGGPGTVSQDRFDPTTEGLHTAE